MRTKIFTYLLIAFVLGLGVAYVIEAIHKERREKRQKNKDFESLKASLRNDLASKYTNEGFAARDFNNRIENQPSVLTKEQEEELFENIYSLFNRSAKKYSVISMKSFMFGITPAVINFIGIKDVPTSDIKSHAETLINKVGRDYMIAKTMVYIENLGYKTQEYANMRYAISVSVD